MIVLVAAGMKSRHSIKLAMLGFHPGLPRR
jgi:hypothetical protein